VCTSSESAGIKNRPIDIQNWTADCSGGDRHASLLFRATITNQTLVDREGSSLSASHSSARASGPVLYVEAQHALICSNTLHNIRNVIL